MARKISGMLRRLFEESSSVRSNHCSAAVCRGEKEFAGPVHYPPIQFAGPLESTGSKKRAPKDSDSTFSAMRLCR